MGARKCQGVTKKGTTPLVGCGKRPSKKKTLKREKNAKKGKQAKVHHLQ